MTLHLKRVLAGLAVFVSIVSPFAAATASAHWHVFIESAPPTLEAPFLITDTLTQQGIYGSLQTPGQVDYYLVRITQYAAFSTWLTVPQTPDCLNFRPKVALIAPGEALPEQANYPAPPGWVSQVFASPLWGRYIDPDSKLAYFAGPRIFPALEPGDYYLAVFDDAGGLGNYLLLVGDQDALGGDPDWYAKATAHHGCPQGLG